MAAGGVTAMRIAELNDIAYVATELTGALRERGHDVTLIRPRLIGATLAPAIKPLVAPARIDDWLFLARKISRGNYDAVHIHYAYLGIVGVLGRFPFILHCHGTDLRSSTPFTRPLIAQALAKARHVFYSTPDLAAFVKPQRPDAEFLPNPINTDRFAPRPLTHEAADVFVACALTANKGVETILAACQQLARTRPDIRITAIAGGEATAAFDAIPNVTLISPHLRSKRPGILGRHRVAVGQIYEGAVGMAELEALACARPVVTHFTYDHVYDVPPPFVQANSPGQVAAAVGRLLDDPALAQTIGASSRDWLVAHHDRRLIAERVETVLKDIVEGRQ
ncbi:glycosyltransferase family 4 protein [bacterium]|nr:glycosyltransferase family 4 protein [bacterium]